MGIFSVNVVAFAMIFPAYFNPGAFGGHRGADLVMWLANYVLIDGKMRALFSMLFGASMLLVIDRAEAAGARRRRVHYARMVGAAAVRPAPFLLHLARRHPRALRAGRDGRLPVPQGERDEDCSPWRRADARYAAPYLVRRRMQMRTADLAAHRPDATAAGDQALERRCRLRSSPTPERQRRGNAPRPRAIRGPRRAYADRARRRPVRPRARLRLADARR